MLIVYLEPFTARHTNTLIVWGDQVRYWPRTWTQQDTYNAAIPSDWWILFNNAQLADLWLMRWPESSRIIRTLLD